MDLWLRRSTGVREATTEALRSTTRVESLSDFEAFYRANLSPIYAYVGGMIRDRQVTEDVTAAVFERAFSRRRKFNPARGEARAWLFRIARNAAIDELRHAGRSGGNRSDWIDVGDLIDDQSEAYGENQWGSDPLVRTSVRKAMLSLSHRERDLVAGGAQLTTVDPAVVRDLTVIDDALSDRTVEGDDSRLVAVVHALRDSRVTPTVEFGDRMDQLVADEFKRPGQQASWSGSSAVSALFRPRVALPAAGAVVALVIAVIVVGGDRSDRNLLTRADPVSGRTESALQPRNLAVNSLADGDDRAAPDASLVQKGSEAASSPATPPSTVGGAARKVERSAQLILAAASTRIEFTADRVIRVVDTHGGYVQTSSVSGGDGSQAGAVFDLRLPANRFNAALAELSRLAHVRSRTQATEDITRSFRSVAQQLSARRAERRGLLRALETSSNPQQIAEIRTRLNQTDRRIARLARQRQRLNSRVNFVRLSVTIEADTTPDGASDDGTWGPGDALRDARRFVSSALAVAILGVAIAAPFGLIAAAAWLGTHAVRRRRERLLNSN